MVDPAGDESADESSLFRLEEDTPAEARAASTRRSRALMIAVAVLGAVAIALAVTTGPTVVRVMRQKDATLQMPEQVADLKRDDSPVAREHAGDLVAVLRAQISDLDSSAAAIYAGPSGEAGKSIMIFGGTTMLWNPGRELDTVLSFIAESGEDGLKELSTVDPGEMGGVMKCGSTQMDNAPLAICGWADHGSIAVALFPGRSTSDAAGLMRTLREAVLKR